MSAPIRVPVEADDATQDLLRVAETPVETNAMNPGTGHENEHAAVGPLVRTLKNPPEIWDLVHETPAHFNPGGAFLGRLTSSKKNLILLTLAVVFISGLCVFAVMTLRDGRKRDGAAAQVQEERATTPIVPATQASAPVSTPVNAQLNTSPSAEYSVDNSPPRPTDPQPADPHADNPVSAGPAPTNSIQPTGASVNNISKRTASLAGSVRAAAALSANKRVTVASGRQNADKSGPARGESETAAGPDTGAKPQPSQTPQTADLKESYEKGSSDPASAKKRSNTPLSPQLIAPPTTNSAPKAKAKVIQWP